MVIYVWVKTAGLCRPGTAWNNSPEPPHQEKTCFSTHFFLVQQLALAVVALLVPAAGVYDYVVLCLACTPLAQTGIQNSAVVEQQVFL